MFGRSDAHSKVYKRLIGMVLVVALISGSGLWVYRQQDGIFWFEENDRPLVTPPDDEVKRQWHLQDMFATTAAAQQEVIRIESETKGLQHIVQDKITAKLLNEAIMRHRALTIDQDHLYVYASLLSDSQQSNPEATALKTKAGSLLEPIDDANALLKSRFLKLGEGTQNRLAAELDNPIGKATVQAWRDEASWNNNTQLSNSLSAFDQMENKLVDPYNAFWQSVEVKSNSEGMTSKSEEKRYQAYWDNLEPERKNGELLASLLEAKVTFDNQRAKAYGYDSALDLVLAQDGLTPESFETIRQQANLLKPLMHQWISLQKEVLKLKRPMAAYDLHLKWYSDGNLSYETSSQELIKATKPFGTRYEQVLTTALTKGWVDPYSREYKSASDYTWGSFKTHPYVLLHYDNSVYSAATMGHELGHAVNNELSRVSQPYETYQNATLKAETAATVNELLLLNQLSLSKDKTVRYEAQVEAINTLTNNLFYQMMATEFEIKIHEAAAKGTDLSATYLCSLWKDLIQSYYGKDYLASELDAYGWAHLDHLYWQYYMYKYVIGVGAASQIVERLGQNDQSFETKYLNFLSSGSQREPVAELKSLGLAIDQPTVFKALENDLQKRLKAVKPKE